MNNQVNVSQHPLILHKLALLRSKVTEAKKFRELLREISLLLFYEATRDLALAPLTVQTPLADCAGYEVAERIGLMPIMRAGLGMTQALLDILPTAQIWHLGLQRNPKTLKPLIYYNHGPKEAEIDLALVIDPTLATGKSAILAVDTLKKHWKGSRIKFMGLVAAPEGVQALTAAHPDVELYLAAIDSRLDEKGNIVPGLGDAGDRQFATL